MVFRTERRVKLLTSYDYMRSNQKNSIKLLPHLKTYNEILSPMLSSSMKLINFIDKVKEFVEGINLSSTDNGKELIRNFTSSVRQSLFISDLISDLVNGCINVNFNYEKSTLEMDFDLISYVDTLSKDDSEKSMEENISYNDISSMEYRKVIKRLHRLLDKREGMNDNLFRPMKDDIINLIALSFKEVDVDLEYYRNCRAILFMREYTDLGFNLIESLAEIFIHRPDILNLLTKEEQEELQEIININEKDKQLWETLEKSLYPNDIRRLPAYKKNNNWYNIKKSSNRVGRTLSEIICDGMKDYRLEKQAVDNRYIYTLTFKFDERLVYEEFSDKLFIEPLTKLDKRLKRVMELKESTKLENQ